MQQRHAAAHTALLAAVKQLSSRAGALLTLGHVCAQFMMVLQRYSLYASSSCSMRSAVKSSRLSMIHLRTGGARP